MARDRRFGIKIALRLIKIALRLEKTQQEDEEMARLFCDTEHPKTLEEIGVYFGLTRERIRQRLKRQGITRKHGGFSARAKSFGVLRAQALQKHREKRCQKKWGVTLEEYSRIHAALVPQHASKIKRIYTALFEKTQRFHVPWIINLAEFTNFIQPHIQSYGRRGQLVVFLKDKTLPYTIDNI
ncbi:MAG: sigma factor-like helix-turn-helix DNA-binding protein, partial [Bdellovibrionota bacterium]